MKHWRYTIVGRRALYERLVVSGRKPAEAYAMIAPNEHPGRDEAWRGGIDALWVETESVPPTGEN